MLDDAPEPVGPLPFDPVHHIASIGCAQRAGIVAVEPCITFGRRREPLLQVLKRPPAPIAANAVGEGRSEEHTPELPSLMRISYADICMIIKRHKVDIRSMQRITHTDHKSIRISTRN